MVRLPGMPEHTREVIGIDAETDIVTIKTGACMFCGQTGEVKMPREAWERYADGQGEHVQNAWPEGSPGEREQLINGSHPACFDKAFPEEEDDGFDTFDPDDGTVLSQAMATLTRQHMDGERA